MTLAGRVGVLIGRPFDRVGFPRLERAPVRAARRAGCGLVFPRAAAGALNVAFSGTSCTTGLTVGDPIEHIRKLGGKIPDARPSMLLDYNAGRRCEVDAINGAIPRLGKPLGVATPVNEAVVGIVRARERRMLVD
jgi:ketopantoate reductase